MNKKFIAGAVAGLVAGVVLYETGVAQKVKNSAVKGWNMGKKFVIKKEEEFENSLCEETID